MNREAALRCPGAQATFDQYGATGNYSLLELTRKSHKEGFVFRKNGQKIQKSVVHKILKNPIYYGAFRWAGKIYEGIHEPLISRELFDRGAGGHG